MMNVFSITDVEFLENNYAQLGAKACSKTIGCTAKQAAHKAEKLGIKVGEEAKRRIVIEASKNRKWPFKVGARQFMDVQTPEAAYILGLLWADGYIGKRVPTTAIEIESIDGETFNRTFQKTGAWGVWHRKARKSTWRPSTMIHTSNTILGDFLIKNDYRSKNSSPDSILSIIPLHLKHYWFRGLFDGDGHIRYGAKQKVYVLSISSCLTQDWKYMEDVCACLDVSFSVKRRIRLRNTGSEFKLTSRSGMLKFCDFIYKNRDVDEIGLDRKYSVYLQIKQQAILSPKPLKYMGISLRKYNSPDVLKWKSWIPRRFHAPKEQEHVGYFNSEEEALTAQQDKIKLLGLVETKRAYK